MDINFQDKLEVLDGKYIVTATVPGGEVKLLKKKILDSMAEHADLPGFRKGHVPHAVLLKKFNSQINEELGMELAGYLADRISEKNNITAGWRPRIHSESVPHGIKSWVGTFDISGAFKIKLQSDIPPTISSLNLDFPVEIAPPDIEADVDEQIHHLRHEFVIRTAKTEPSTEKDEVVCTVKVFDELTGKEEIDLRVSKFPFSFDLKSHSMLSSALADKLIGVTAGQNLSFKEGDFRFDIEIHAVNEKTLPKINEEFLTKLGYQNLEDLRTEVRREWLERNAVGYKLSAHVNVRRALLKANPFPVPESWVDENVKAAMGRLDRLGDSLGFSEEAIKEESEMFAGSDYLLEVILDKDAELSKLSDADIYLYAAEEVNSTAKTPDQFLTEILRSGQYTTWLKTIKKKKALDWLLIKNKKEVGNE